MCAAFICTEKEGKMEQVDRIIVTGQCGWWLYRCSFILLFIQLSWAFEMFKIKDILFKIWKQTSKLKHVLFLKADFSLKWIWHRSKLISKAWAFWSVPLIEIQSWDTNYSEWSGYLMSNLLFFKVWTILFWVPFFFDWKHQGFI